MEQQTFVQFKTERSEVVAQSVEHLTSELKFKQGILKAEVSLHN
jgi:hypothetical protein